MVVSLRTLETKGFGVSGYWETWLCLLGTSAEPMKPRNVLTIFPSEAFLCNDYPYLNALGLVGGSNAPKRTEFSGFLISIGLKKIP